MSYREQSAFNSIFGGLDQQQPVDQVQVTYVQLDDFIDRCLKEKDYTPQHLMQDIQVRLESAEIISFTELQVLPSVQQRIAQRFARQA